MEKRSRFDLLRGERGASLLEFALVLPLFMLLLFGAVDFGRAYYLSMEVAGAAQAGAVYGIQNPGDITGIQTAAVADAPNVSGLTATATSISECSDGTHSPNASLDVCKAEGTTCVALVTVSVNATYTPLFPWPGIPKSITLSQQAAMRSLGS